MRSTFRSPGRRKCDLVAPASASEGYVLSRTLPNSGEGVRHSSGEEERAEYAKSFEVEVARAPAHVLRGKVALNCGKEADGNRGRGRAGVAGERRSRQVRRKPASAVRCILGLRVRRSP